MVLKDVQCVHCGTVRELMLEGDERSADVECVRCGKLRIHRTVCNGGCRGARWRFQDWDGFDPTGHVEHIGVKAGRPHPDAVGTADESRTATVETMKSTGRPVHEQARFSREGIADRRERRRHVQRRREGRLPLWFNR